MLQLNLEDDVQANARSEHSNLLPWHQLQSWSFTAQCIAQLVKVWEISTPNPSAKPREASAAKLLIFSKHFFPFFILPIIQWECEGRQKKKKQTNNKPPVGQVCTEHAEQHGNGSRGHQGTYLDQSITVAGNRHFASYQAFRCFLSHKKAKVQKSRGGKERLKSHSSIHTSAKFIFVDYSGKHTSAVFHDSDYPLLHWQSEVLPEVPFIDP